MREESPSGEGRRVRRVADGTATPGVGQGAPLDASFDHCSTPPALVERKLHGLKLKYNCPERSVRRWPGRAPQDPLVADSPRQAIGIEALQEELRGPARDPQEVAEPRQCDPARRLALAHERCPRQVVGAARDREAVADPDEAALLLE